MISFNSFLGQNWRLRQSQLSVTELASLSYLHQHQPAAPAISPSFSPGQFWENTEILLCSTWPTSVVLSSSLERTKWFRNRDLFILYFKSGCLLAWFDVSLFASSAIAEWTELWKLSIHVTSLKIFKGQLIEVRVVWGISVLEQSSVVINKIIPRLNIGFHQARITQSSNQQS